MTEIEMKQAIAEERRQYHKQWRDKNKDKIRKYNENYWKKKAIERTEKGASQ